VLLPNHALVVNPLAMIRLLSHKVNAIVDMRESLDFEERLSTALRAKEMAYGEALLYVYGQPHSIRFQGSSYTKTSVRSVYSSGKHIPRQVGHNPRCS
jgi:hypothetical protein